MDNLIKLLDEDTINSYTSMADERDTYLQKLGEFLTPETLNDYIQRYEANDTEDTAWMTKPVDLLIAGKQLSQISETQNEQVISQIKKKCKGLDGPCTRLSDVLAELGVATCTGFYYDVELDKKTGVGKKDADVYVPKTDVYLEVKNYVIGRSKFEKLVAKDIKKLEADGQKGSYRTGDFELIKQSSSDNFLAVDMSDYDSSSQVVGMLQDAHSKFSENQTAIVFIMGLPLTKTSIHAIDAWKCDNPHTAIKGVFILNGRNSVTNVRSTYWHELTLDKVVADFLKTIELV